MATTLGLDIGTNSIGWCLVEDGKRIVDMGSRIFPVGVKEDSYAKSGTEESKNAARRKARSIRRGYDRYHQRRDEMARILTEHGMMFDKEQSLPTKELYGLRRKALDLKLEPQELGRVFFLLNQRRGFKSNRKDAGKTGEEEKELTGMKAAMSELENAVKAKGSRTVGEYFASLFDNQPEHWHNANEPVERIRKRFVNRKLYQAEFEAIWEKQRSFHPTLLTDALKEKLRDRVIFFQRPLKSAKHLVGKCRFEPQKHVMPRSHPLFQEFRLWQRLNDIKVTIGDRVNEYLTNDERATLAAELGGKESMTLAAIKKLMGWHSSTTFNDIGLKVMGCTTVAKIAEAVGEEWYWEQTPADRLKLWHTLYFAADDAWVERYAQEKLGMNDEQAMKYADVKLEQDYGNISHKAASRIVPFLVEGYDYAEACEQAGYHHSQAELDKPDRELTPKIDTAAMEPVRNPLVQMSVNETARLVNAIIDEHGKPDLVRVELLRELKQPKAKREQKRNSMRDKEKLRDEYRDFLRAKKVIADPRMSDIKKFELWLELEHSEHDLAKLNPLMDLKAFSRFAQAVNSKDKEKFHLWLECGRVSPYTGNIIPLSKLFTEQIHVEHILPYSRSLDDSFTNKTLCEDAINDLKGNLTPLEYYEAKCTSEEFKAFKQRVKHFGQGKLNKFLATEVKDDFLNSQFTNSAYIGTEVRKLLRTTCKDVRVTNGQLTGLLRRVWKLNELLNTEKDQKNRDDHRHHSVDALVIATITQGLINRISKESQFDYRGNQRVPDIGLPWPQFRTDAADKLNGMLVSYKGGKRLLSSKLNKYIHSKAHDGKPEKFQRTKAVRGPLHEEKLYGKINNPWTGSETYVIRKPISEIDSFERVQKIIDPAIRKLFIDQLEPAIRSADEQGLTDKKRKAALAKAVKALAAVQQFMPTKPGKEALRVPIKSVRLEVNTEEMIEIRTDTFVEPGNNYCIAIYEDAKGKRAFRTVSFFDASQRALRKEPIYPAEVEGKKLLMTLQQRDLVVLYENHHEEIQWDSPNWMAQHVYMIRAMDKRGELRLVLHKAANVDPNTKADREARRYLRLTVGRLKAVRIRLNAMGKLEAVK